MSALAIVTVLALAPAFATAQAETPPVPLQKVVLYKNGVGFFVHRGNVELPATIRLQAPAFSADDMLKSLTLTGVPASALDTIGYPSVVPACQRLPQFPLNLGSMDTLVKILRSLQGAEVAVTTAGGTVTGRILNAEAVPGDSTAGPRIWLSLWLPAGEIHLIALDSTTVVRFAEPSLRGALGDYLAIRADEQTIDIREIEVRLSGGGRTDVQLSYLMEAPVWKTTYRLILNEQKEATLYGWALVDNTTPYDWNGVELSLMAGAPISFRQRVSEAVYADRPELPVVTGPAPAPPTHGGDLERLGEEGVGVQEKASRDAEAAAPESVVSFSVVERPRDLMRTAGMAAAVSFPEQTAEAYRLAEQFEYRIQRPITLARNRSAAVAILQAEIPAETVSIYRPGSSGNHPFRSVRLENTTDLTLDGGPLHVVREGLFAGEGVMETVQPKERRLLSFAVDLAVEVVRELKPNSRRETARWTGDRGVLTVERREWRDNTYTIANRDTEPREVLIEHPKTPEYLLAESLNPEETTADYYRFRASVPAQTTRKVEVSEFRILEERLEIGSWPVDGFLSFLQRGDHIPEELRRRLERIAETKRRAAGLEEELAGLRRQIDGIFRDQERIRENLSRLGDGPGEAELKRRYLETLDRQEGELNTLRVRQEQNERSLEQVQAELRDLLEEFSGTWSTAR